jgi:hypothetical protein
MALITARPSSISLPLSRLALSWLNPLLLLPVRLSPLYVDMSSSDSFYMLSCAFLQLFGWDIGTLWETCNKKLILALLGAGKLGEAFESYRSAVGASDEATKASLHTWILSESP